MWSIIPALTSTSDRQPHAALKCQTLVAGTGVLAATDGVIVVARHRFGARTPPAVPGRRDGVRTSGQPDAPGAAYPCLPSWTSFQGRQAHRSWTSVKTGRTQSAFASALLIAAVCSTASTSTVDSPDLPTCHPTVHLRPSAEARRGRPGPQSHRRCVVAAQTEHRQSRRRLPRPDRPDPRPRA